MKKVLIVSSVASMIDQFNRDNIRILKELGYEVHVATNFEDPGTITRERVEVLKMYLKEKKVKYYQINFNRNPFKLSSLKNSIDELTKVSLNNYDFVHLHSPIGGIVGRIVFKKTNTKIIYTAHGFHFFKGAPIKNWLIYYPIEKYFSKFTDVLLTINSEDYELSKKKLKSKKVIYVDGVGVNNKNFKVKNNEEIDYIRKQNGFISEDFLLIYVGELSKRKNQANLIKSLSIIENKRIKLLLVGKGSLEIELKKLCKTLNVEERVFFLGYRTDIYDLMGMSDVVVSSSKQEGLPVNLIEGLCVGKPLLVSDCRGNRDLVDDTNNGYIIRQNDINTFSNKIIELFENKKLYESMSINSLKKSKKFSLDKISNKMLEIYSDLE